MAAIRDVARQAGVAIGTASRAVNGHPSVSPELKARVLRAVAELGYRPNALARGLRSQRTHTLGLVIPDITNPFFGELAKCIEQAAADRGYSVILGNSNDDRATEAVYVEMLASRQVDGLALIPTPETRALPDLPGIPVVVVDRVVKGYPGVTSDHRAGARLAVEHLVVLGHRRIGCIAGPGALIAARERHRGYLSVVEPLYGSLGWAVAEDVAVARFDYESGYEAARGLLDRPSRPTALFASSDQQAIGALRAAADLGLDVPGDLSIVGFDAIPLASLVTPRLTTVAQPIAALAAAAVRRLLEPAGEAGMRLRLATTLQLGGSSGPPRNEPGPGSRRLALATGRTVRAREDQGPKKGRSTP